MPPKISIIIPVYNAAQYLVRCLESAVRQAESDIEIVCVDDCSTDNSPNILDNYKKLDRRIKIITCKENGGESKARNIGVAHATGEYLAFLDNDDILDKNYCSVLYKTAIEYGADFIKGRAKIIGYDGKETYSLEQTQEDILHKSRFYFLTYWWTAIYRTAVVKNKIFFPEDCSLGGDLLFLLDFLVASNKYFCIDDVVYYYLRRKDSGDSQILSLNKANSVLMVTQRMAEILNSNAVYVSDKFGYAYQYSMCIERCLFHTVYRTLPEDKNDAARLCANKALSLYDDCAIKDEINKLLSQKDAKALSFILKRDIDSLAWWTTLSPMQKLRFKLKNSIL